MELPLERGDTEVFTSGREAARAEHMYADEESDQGRAGTSISTNNETESESSEVEEPTAEHHSERKSKEEESDSSSDKSSDNDSETEDDPDHDDAFSEDFFVRATDQGTLAGKQGDAGDGKPYSQEVLHGPEVLGVENFTAPSSGAVRVANEITASSSGAVRVANEITPEIAESIMQASGDLSAGSSECAGELLGDNAEVLISTGQEEYRMHDNLSSNSLKLSGVEESMPSVSLVGAMKDARSELLEFDEHGSEDTTSVNDDFVRKGFTCDGGTEEDDEQLREYWTRALQTSSSTGEIVEEIVKVLKHRQKTHDLLCPVCGSCVTRRVILRKRKRSSLISVDRWYRDTLDEEEIQEQEDARPEDTRAVEEPDMQEEHDVEAFGCLSCFSLFFKKGRQLFSQLQADIGPDTFNCLPFFFPPYPWGMTQMRPRTTELNVVVPPRSEEIDESLEPADRDVRASFTCGTGSMLLPDYPWGTMPRTFTGSPEEGSSLEVTDVTPLRGILDASAMDVRHDFTCGIGSTFLPDYSWGTMHLVSKEKLLDQTDIEAGIDLQDVEPQRQGIAESSPGSIEERTCSCGMGPNFLPAYPWGVCRKQERDLDDVRGLSQSVQASEPLINESNCTCGVAQALFPEYRWGFLTKAEDVPLQSLPDLKESLQDSSPVAVPIDANVESVSQLEISEEVPQLPKEDKDCTCGLVPALLPDYSWGSFEKDKDVMESKIDKQVKTMKESEGKEAEDSRSSTCVPAFLPDYPWGITSAQEFSGDVTTENQINIFENGAPMRIGSAILPSYPWGKCSIHFAGHGEKRRVQPQLDAADRDCTCGLGFTMLPKFPWGQQTLSTAANKEQTVSRQEVKNYIEQETKIETRITSKTDVYTVTSTKMTYPGEKPPQNIKAAIPNKTSQSLQHVKLDQTVTVIDLSVKVNEAAGVKGPPLASLPSTGFALMDLAEEGLGGKARLETRPSTGYAQLEEFTEDHELPISEIEEDPASSMYTRPEGQLDSNWDLVSEKTYYNDKKTEPQIPSSGTQFPSFDWSVGKVDAVDLTTPLLKASVEPESETFISVFKPSSGGIDEPKNDNWLSIFKVSKPSDESGLAGSRLSPASAHMEEIEEVKRPVSHPQVQAAPEAVIDVPPGDSGRTSVGTTDATAPALMAEKKKEGDGWEILKAIVYGGLDISIASLGVTSSAAGGNAITRTVVYMGLATLFSGLIGFYHNVLNLYHHHKDHYTNLVGLTLILHGTVSLISYVVFGLLSPLIYAFSYRKTDDRDNKFILCCGVTVVAVIALSLGKARVSNKRYLRTVSAYLLGGVLAAIVGYLTGEHVAELLEKWGI